MVPSICRVHRRPHSAHPPLASPPSFLPPIPSPSPGLVLPDRVPLQEEVSHSPSFRHPTRRSADNYSSSLIENFGLSDLREGARAGTRASMTQSEHCVMGQERGRGIYGSYRLANDLITQARGLSAVGSISNGPPLPPLLPAPSVPAATRCGATTEKRIFLTHGVDGCLRRNPFYGNYYCYYQHALSEQGYPSEL